MTPNETTTGSTTHLTIAGRSAGYYFPTYRSDTFAAYFIPRSGDRRGRYLGQFPCAESACRAIAAR